MAVIETTLADTTADRAPPTITLANPLFGLEGLASPDFAGSTITDPTAGATDTLTIHVGDASVNGADQGIGGTITGDGLTQVDASTYTLTGTASQVTAELNALLVTPASVSLSALIPVSTSLTFSVQSDLPGTNPVYASTTALLYEAPCYAAGTRIAIVSGEVLVEDLRAGDVVSLATGGTTSVVWVGHRRVRKADPVRVVAGAFGTGLPARDLVLSPEHALFLDWHLIPARALVDGMSVIQEAWDSVTYHHIELVRHGVLLAEGLPAESYLDTGNRASFANGAQVSLTADFERGSEPVEACAPFALTGRVVETQRAKLQAIALGQHRAAA